MRPFITSNLLPQFMQFVSNLLGGMGVVFGLMLFPSFSLRGLGDYLGLASGIVLGFALFTAPMQNLTSSLKKKDA